MAESNRWTVNTLLAHVKGLLNVDRNAAGGAVVDRLKTIIIRSGMYLWDMRDWRFRHKQGTLTTSASVAYVDMPADFGELDHRALRDNAARIQLYFTERFGEWQRYADQWVAGYTAAPRYCIIARQSDGTDRAMLSPTPDDAYSLDYWYVAKNPWVAASALSDDASPNWPSSMDEGWEMRATWFALRAFRRDDSWKDSEKMFEKWLDQEISENDQKITVNDEPIKDGYSDFAALAPDSTGYDDAYTLNQDLPRWL